MKKTFAWMKNYLGNKFYPYTHSDAVYVGDAEEKNLTTVLSDIHGQIVSGLAGKDIFDSHLTDNAAHRDLFDSKLNSGEAGKFIKDISSDASAGIITVTRQDNTAFTITIPKSLIFQSAVFHEQSNEIIVTWSDNSESRIPAEGLVNIYTGSEGNIIQIEIDDNNIISAVVKESSIEKNYLSQNVQNILDASNEHLSNAEKHIPNGGNSGQIIGMTKEGIEWINLNDSENYITKDDFASIEKQGVVKPDGYTTVCSNNGTITTQHIKTINIDEGTDLNTVLSPGFYCCQTTDTAKSLFNCPVQTPFSMVVTYATGTSKSSAIQELTTYTVDNPKTYKRSVYHHNVNDVHTIGNWYLIYDENNRPPETGLVSYFSIADLGLDSGSKYTIMEIFENMPSKCILYLEDCANVSDYPNMGALTPSVTINKLTLNACYAVAMSRSVGDGTFRMAYKILRNNDPKGETEWIEMYSEENLTTESLGALPITGGTLESNDFPQLKVKRTQSGQSAAISLETGDGELIMLEAVAANNEEHVPELWIRDRSDNTRLLHLSKQYKKIYDPKSNSLKEILVNGDTVNNLLATEPGNPLDAVQGKALADMIASQNSNFAKSLDEINGNLGNLFPVQNGNPVAKHLNYIATSSAEDILSLFKTMGASTFWCGYTGSAYMHAFTVIARQQYTNRGCALVVATHMGRIILHQINNNEIAGSYTVDLTKTTS